MSDTRIMIGTADVTEHVAAMFDAIVGSLDWGSGFLSVEQIESILIVGALAGFDVPEFRYHSVDPAGFENWPGGTEANYAEWQSRRLEAIQSWRAQVQAKARAMRDHSGDLTAERKL